MTGEVMAATNTPRKEETTDRVTVAYIVGWGRSGTTILDNILGEIPGFFSVGELDYLWSRGLAMDFLCGCGRSLRECSIWSEILDRPFRDRTLGEVPPSEVVAWQRSMVRTRHTWRLLRKGRLHNSEDLASYAELIASLYRAIADVTGAQVIVDSSKRPSGAALLSLLDGIDPFVIHMVRDPRAVAYSWRRRKAQPGFGDDREMLLHPAWKSSIHWVTWNLAAAAVRRKVPASTVVRYEDLIGSPKDSLTSLIQQASPTGLQKDERSYEELLPLEGERGVRLGVNHTVSGNPSRFKHGLVELRSDDEWRTAQNGWDRTVSTAFTLPWLKQYGYRIRA